ncbi:VanZ family protein [Solwaraspora sp. WMMD406]|uniref:VanZ family protein n=1 Tax=Solwaraspora sp. WMMD406 TaxID=3016095 RepID=UPI002417CA2C|nr:VanZ family protein [Solwaraspora sp. WMMD406]MDG4768358.1 VanZ family protein [Solwaraspora sp. WMMD406]
MLEQWLLAQWLISPTTITAWTVGTALAVAISLRIARSKGFPVLPAAAAAVSIVPILVLSVLPFPGSSYSTPASGALGSFLGQFTDPSLIWYIIINFGNSAEKVANIAIFTPVTHFATIATRSPGRVLLFLTTMSLLIEAFQTATGRLGDVGDVLHNSAGALIGLLLALLTQAGKKSIQQIKMRPASHIDGAR